MRLHVDTQLIHVRSEDIESQVGPALAIEAARRGAVAGATGQVTTRRCSISFEGGWMRVMAAEVSSLGVFGYKEFHLNGNKTVRYLVHVFDTASGRPIGIVDAALITTLRTAATSAVAVRHLLGRRESVRLGVVGSGSEAMAGVAALSQVVGIETVQVTSRSAENRERFVHHVRDATGLTASSCESVTEALADVDVVYVATNSGGRVVLDHDAVAHVPIVASIGSTLPAQRELAGEVLTRADVVVVDTLEVLEESGDALEAMRSGWDHSSVMLLGDALVGDAPEAPVERAVYKSIGSPEQDLVLAAAILESAAEHGFGRRIEALSAVKENL